MSTKLLNHFWDAQGLTASEKLVLISLADQANDLGYCWPSIDALVGRTVSRGTLFRALAKLEAEGYVVAEARARGSSTYWLMPRDPEILSKPDAGDRREGRIHPLLREGWTLEAHLDDRARRSSAVKAGIAARADGDGSQIETHDLGSQIETSGVSDRDSGVSDRDPPGSQIETQNHHRTTIEPPEEPPARGRAGARGKAKEWKGPHLLPSDWRPSPQSEEYARRLGVSPAYEAMKARTWAETKGSRKTDWDAFWRKWIERAAFDLAKRQGKEPPAVNWDDCAPPDPAKSKAKPQDPRIQPRLVLLNRWLLDDSVKCPPPPAWLGTPEAARMPPDRMVAELDDWIAEAARRSGLQVPALPGGTQPSLAIAAE